MVTKTLVLGIGNPIMQDDGVGVYVVQRLKADQPELPLVDFLDGGTLSFSLIGEIESADHLIVIDAAQLDGEPGAIRTFLNEEMDQFLGQQKNSSVHDVTLIDLLSIALLSDRLPAKRALIGIQPASLELGTEPTPAIEMAIPKACRITVELLEKWNA
ncbi:HyaD/HybD family hydrogenase maturation endopeptidase [Methylomonas sp. 11b]|uniref:HyaD/HybD family hydrogenase maturation endopeptidase n=1 Tax=Methylomonas sp. 11b TaxID=1168169 RepID=UPI00047BB1D1|nr:HyaD/HybD family hydrogenase maturation endopeptidase [Methylomonas sp. 11b]